MSREDHPIKASSSTAGIIALIISLTPEVHRRHDLFIYTISALPAFMVWAQNWCWKNGGAWIDDAKLKFKAWRIERRVRNALSDPLINSDHKSQLTSAYSKSKTANLIQDIDKMKDSL